MRTYYVYQLLNLVSQKSYIGSTYDINQRINNHKHGKFMWQKDFNEHPENWQINILEEDISEEDIAVYELYYIYMYDTVNNGYNLSYQTTRTKNKPDKNNKDLTEFQKQNLEYISNKYPKKDLTEIQKRNSEYYTNLILSDWTKRINSKH